MIHALPHVLAFSNPLQAARAPPAARPRLAARQTVGLTWAWSIVALTVIVRILLVPVTVQQIHSMQNLQAHAPEMKALQQKWKHDKQRQNEELMKFYRENKINPAASCLPMVLQIPIFISLFYVLRHFDERVLPVYVGSSVDWLAPRRHHRAGQGRLGTAAARHLRREPAVLVVLHVDDDAGRPADPADGAAGRSSSPSSSTSPPA